MSWEGEESALAAEEVSVADVYELAAAIGKQCELLIGAHGPEAVAGLLPRLVAALELLEALAARAERERLHVQDLADKVAHLENDKLERQQCRQRFDKELEIIEEQWRTESAELVSAISRLQEENRRLIKEREGSEGESESLNVMTTSGEQLWIRMGETNEQQRVSLREKDVLIEDKETIIEGLTDQVKRLAASNREARRKQKYLMHQMRLLCAQRAELEAGVQARQREVVSLREALTNEQNGSGNGAQMAELIRERDHLREQLENLERKIKEESEPPASLEMPNDEGATSYLDDDEPPVQGPLPYEPDDAPWKRQQSGIRKLATSSISTALTEEECSCQTRNTNSIKPKSVDLSFYSGPSSSVSNNIPVDVGSKCNINQKQNSDNSEENSEYSDAITDYYCGKCEMNVVSDCLAYTSQFKSQSITITKSDYSIAFNDERNARNENNLNVFIDSEMSSDVGSECSFKFLERENLPDYGIVCRFCLKRKPVAVASIPDNLAIDLATEIYNSSPITACDRIHIRNNVMLKQFPTEFLVCTAAAIECLVSLWLRHYDHR